MGTSTFYIVEFDWRLQATQTDTVKPPPQPLLFTSITCSNKTFDAKRRTRIAVSIHFFRRSLAGRAFAMRDCILLLLAVSIIHSEALATPGSHKSSLPVQFFTPTLIDVPLTSSGLFIRGSALTITGRYNQYHNDKRYRTKLFSSVINGNVDNNDELLMVHEFQPRTMKVSESFAFFARFVVQTILDNRSQKRSGLANRRRLRDRIFRTTNREMISTTTITSSFKPKRGFRESMHKLNESRKSLIRLVGYDSSLLVPAFGYLIMGAFMSSIIPYYYSSCISCVAAGEANRDKLLWALGGLGVSHVFEAIFTGLRGALFWIAGECFFTFCFHCLFLMAVDFIVLNYIILWHMPINFRHSSQLQRSSETSSQSLTPRGCIF